MPLTHEILLVNEEVRRPSYRNIDTTQARTRQKIEAPKAAVSRGWKHWVRPSAAGYDARLNGSI
jgi:soluble lytic murein transglycosylase-like protein